MATEFSSHTQLMEALRGLAHDECISVALTPQLAESIQAFHPINRRLRPGGLAKLTREVESGSWHPLKGTPVTFLPDGSMSNGQHRCCVAVQTGKTFNVLMGIVGDTLGMDEGTPRTLADHLGLRGLEETEAFLAAMVTKAITKQLAPTNRDFLDIFEKNESLVMESVRKTRSWLEDQMPSITAAFKPPMIAVVRARAIHEKGEDPGLVDQFLHDAINGGVTAPEGSVRRQLAVQFFDAMMKAFADKAAKRAAVLKWLLTALADERKGIVKNILHQRGVSRKKRADKRSQPQPKGQ